MRRHWANRQMTFPFGRHPASGVGTIAIRRLTKMNCDEPTMTAPKQPNSSEMAQEETRGR